MEFIGCERIVRCPAPVTMSLVVSPGLMTHLYSPIWARIIEDLEVEHHEYVGRDLRENSADRLVNRFSPLEKLLC